MARTSIDARTTRLIIQVTNDVGNILYMNTPTFAVQEQDIRRLIDVIEGGIELLALPDEADDQEYS